MVLVPIAYFQVAATAIPTLLVAMAVGMKHGTNLAESMKGATKWERGLMAVFGVAMAFMVSWGETLSLLALVKGRGEVWQAGHVFSAIASLIFIVIYEFVYPIKEALGKLGSALFNVALPAIWMLVMATFLIGIR